MNVLIPNVHGLLTASFCKAFAALGGRVYVPDSSFANAKPGWPNGIFGHQWCTDISGHRQVYGLDNCITVSQDEIADLDIDLIVVGARPVEYGVLHSLLPHFERRKTVYVAYFCGNELPRYRWDLLQNLLCADERSWAKYGHRVRNATRYYPWIDYERFRWHSCSDNRLAVSCISHYRERYPREAEMAQQIAGSVLGLTYQSMDGLSPDEVSRMFQEAAMTLHIKPEEGYGYAVIESLASGRPILAPRKYVQGRAMQYWCLHNESALLFESLQEAREQIARYFDDADMRHRLQEGAARTIRRVIDNDEQSDVLKRFLEGLLPLKERGLVGHFLDWRYRRRIA